MGQGATGAVPVWEKLFDWQKLVRFQGQLFLLPGNKTLPEAESGRASGGVRFFLYLFAAGSGITVLLRIPQPGSPSMFGRNTSLTTGI